MKKLARYTCSLLAVSMVFTACSSKKDDAERDHTVIDVEAYEDEEDEDANNNNNSDNSEYVCDRSMFNGRFYIEPAPDYLTNYYDEIELNERLLTGDYAVYNNLAGEYSDDDFNQNTAWTTIDELIGSDSFRTESYTTDLSYYGSISVFPYIMRSGSGYNLGYIDDYSFCEVAFKTSDNSPDSVDTDNLSDVYLYAVQEVHNNQLTLRFLSEYSVGDNGIITYQFTGKEITYDLAIRYGRIILTYNNTEVILAAPYLDSDYVAFMDDWSTYSTQIDNIISLNYSSDSTNRDNDYFTVECDSPDSEYDTYYYGLARFTEDGIFSFAYTDNDGSFHTHHFVIIRLGNDGFVLANENGMSYFTSWSEAYFADRNEAAGYVGVNVLPEDESALNGLSQDEIQALIGIKDSFFSDVEEAFSSQGFNVVIDSENGTITLDASVLYATNEYEINDDGAAVLDSFASAILSVFDSGNYDSLFSQILIQGHTDSNGNYDDNVELSNNRANAVLEYLAAVADGYHTDNADYFRNILVAEGCASDNLIYNDDGTENQEASRRVEFVFYFNLDFLNN